MESVAPTIETNRSLCVADECRHVDPHLQKTHLISLIRKLTDLLSVSDKFDVHSYFVRVLLKVNSWNQCVFIAPSMSRGRKGKNLGSKSQTVSRPVEAVDRERHKKVRVSLLSLRLQVDACR